MTTALNVLNPLLSIVAHALQIRYFVQFPLSYSQEGSVFQGVKLLVKFLLFQPSRMIYLIFVNVNIYIYIY